MNNVNNGIINVDDLPELHEGGRRIGNDDKQNNDNVLSRVEGAAQDERKR